MREVVVNTVSVTDGTETVGTPAGGVTVSPAVPAGGDGLAGAVEGPAGSVAEVLATQPGQLASQAFVRDLSPTSIAREASGTAVVRVHVEATLDGQTTRLDAAGNTVDQALSRLGLLLPGLRAALGDTSEVRETLPGALRALPASALAEAPAARGPVTGYRIAAGATRFRGGLAWTAGQTEVIAVGMLSEDALADIAADPDFTITAEHGPA